MGGGSRLKSLGSFAGLAGAARLFGSRATLCFMTFVLSGCGEEEVEWSGPPKGELNKLYEKNRGKPQARSADRLPPGDLLEGPDEFFGFAVPRGMRGRLIAPGLVEITGHVDFDKLATYTKDRIAVRHAEMLEDQLVFRNARILGTKDRLFELTLNRQRKESRLEIQDITKTPAPQGLSEDERWKRAGLKPSGGLIDPNSME